MVKFRLWVKKRESRFASAIYRVGMWWRSAQIRPIPFLHSGLYQLHRYTAGFIRDCLRIFWYTPLFQSQLETPAKNLSLNEGMPNIMGPLRVKIGAGCRMPGRCNLMGWSESPTKPVLEIGDNCDIGYGTSIAVGNVVRIGNNVRISGGCVIVGYPGHPVDAADRARGLPNTADQIGEIIIEDDVWIASRVTINRGVHIGRGAIIGVGSIVVSDIPPFVVAGGVPARVLKRLALPKDFAPLNGSDAQVLPQVRKERCA